MTGNGPRKQQKRLGVVASKRIRSAGEIAQRLERLLGNLPGMAYRCLNEPTWPMEFVSEGCEALTGYLAEAMISGDVVFGLLIVAEDRDRVWLAVQNAVAADTPFRLTYRIEHADGGVRWLWEQGRGVRGDDGEVVALEGFICDITETENARAEAESTRFRLRESEARHRGMMEQASDGIILGDHDLVIHDVNQRTAEMLLRTRASLIGLPFVELVEPEDVKATPIQRLALFDRRSLLIERRLIRGDGSVGTYEISSRVLEDGSVLAIMRDTSLRRAAEEDRIRALRDMLETKRLASLGLLAGGVAHDFNNLLATISGSAELALLEWPEGVPGRARIERALLAAERAHALTRQLMSYAGGAVDAAAPLDLDAVLAEIPLLLKLPLGADARLRIEAHGALPAIDGEASRLRQMAMNLVLNAAESLEGGPGYVIMRTAIDDGPPTTTGVAERVGPSAVVGGGAFVRFEVEDNGCGIAPSALDAAWEPFVSSKGPGRGLGLAAVVGIVQSHHGELRISTFPGAGTHVRVWLPVSAAALPPVEPGVKAELSPLSGRLLVVDDDNVVRAVVCEMCRALGLETAEASSGEDCLARLTTDRRGFDAVLLDVTMPGMGGVAAWQALALRWPAMPVIFVSGQSIPELKIGLGHLRPRFLLKPFGIHKLRATLADLIARSDRRPKV